jgi:diguanylate cyclase (GGDEF)-like protein
MTMLNTPEKIELRRKRHLIYTFASIGSLFLTSFGIISLSQERYLLAGILLLMSVLVMMLAYACHQYRAAQPVSIIIASLLMLLAPYLVLSGSVAGTGVYWSYSIAMLMILLVGPFLGIFYMVVYLAVLTFGLSSDYSFIYSYEPGHVPRILASTLALFILIAASEWIRNKSYGQISNTSENHRHQAQTDSLTGMVNRSGFSQTLESWQNTNQPAVIALIDLDHFKNINDRFGHDTGDKVLIFFSKVLKQNIKGKDTLVRWGGEEFLLFLPETTLEEACSLMKILRTTIQKTPFSADHDQINIAFSAGLSELISAEDFDNQLKLADQRLYAAKNAGRDRFVAA